MQEFSGRATGISATFRPTVIGFAAVLDNVSALADNLSRPLLITAAGVTYLALLTFVAGGIIDRYARDRPTRALGFFSACGVFFPRFLRLGVLSGVVYTGIFRWVHPWLFAVVYARLTQETAVERTAFLVRFGLYAVLALLLAGFNLLFDYAKVRAVVEDRHSMLGAVIAAARFLRRNPGPAVSLYLLNLVLVAILMAIYALVAPGAGTTGWTMWTGFAVGPLYLIGRLWVNIVP